jgi:hypothetical protein
MGMAYRSGGTRRLHVMLRDDRHVEVADHTEIVIRVNQSLSAGCSSFA